MGPFWLQYILGDYIIIPLCCIMGPFWLQYILGGAYVVY
jgi:hypothetical protein